MWTVTTAFLLRVAQGLIHAAAGQPAGPLNGVWCGLYTAPGGPINQFTTLAGLTEANYDGYSRQLVTWFPPWISTAGPELLTAQDVWFSPTGNLVSNLITGVFLADAFYGGVLLMGAPTTPPGVLLSGPTTAMKVQPQFQLPFQSIYGAPAIVS